MWFGTDGGGVSRRSPDGRWATFATDDELGDHEVYAFKVDVKDVAD